jgi:hypothetical protein
MLFYISIFYFFSVKNRKAHWLVTKDKAQSSQVNQITNQKFIKIQSRFWTIWQYNRHFQRNQEFIILCYNLDQRSHNIIQANLIESRKNWPATKTLLLNLIFKSLKEVTEQTRTYEFIINFSVKELLKMISQIKANASESDEYKSYLLV